MVMVAGLSGCSIQLPSFVGREGDGEDTFKLGGTPVPDPVPIDVASARVEPALNGYIILVEGIAPTAGYNTALLMRPDSLPDAPQSDGPPPETIDFQLLAVPPIGPAPPEPAAARVLRAGYFLPEDHVRRIRSIRLRGATSVQTLPLEK